VLNASPEWWRCVLEVHSGDFYVCRLRHMVKSAMTMAINEHTMKLNQNAQAHRLRLAAMDSLPRVFRSAAIYFSAHATSGRLNTRRSSHYRFTVLHSSTLITNSLQHRRTVITPLICGTCLFASALLDSSCPRSNLIETQHAAVTNRPSVT
jgi:hypothetical protein